MQENDITEEINKKIQDLQRKILSRQINLLELELVPYFNELKDSITVLNLQKSSETYHNAYLLLNQKFNELKSILNSLETQETFFNYLTSNPSDFELYELINGCWKGIFTIDSLSLDFLELSQERLLKDAEDPIIIKHLKRGRIGGDFLLEIPMRQFTEKMENYYESIKEKLPCQFEEIFEGEEDQQKIYDNFVFILHLLQLDKIKYLKETNTLYV